MFYEKKFGDFADAFVLNFDSSMPGDLDHKDDGTLLAEFTSVADVQAFIGGMTAADDKDATIHRPEVVVLCLHDDADGIDKEKATIEIYAKSAGVLTKIH